jgi:hypothetical protein
VVRVIARRAVNEHTIDRSSWLLKSVHREYLSVDFVMIVARARSSVHRKVSGSQTVRQF